jgi:hypothetical protein
MKTNQTNTTYVGERLQRVVSRIALIFILATPAFGQTPNGPLQPAVIHPSPVVWVQMNPGAWSWLEDYAFSRATYIVGCPPERHCSVGSGVFFRGGPRGSTIDFVNDVEITVFGFGALHVLVKDGAEPARVGFYKKSHTLIPIYPPPRISGD